MELGQDHPSQTSMSNLASMYWNQGWWKEAEELQVLVMEMTKWVLGKRHPDLLTSMDNLVLTYRNQGQWKEAEAPEVLVMVMTKWVPGEEHPHSLRSIGNLASMYQNPELVEGGWGAGNTGDGEVGAWQGTS